MDFDDLEAELDQRVAAGEEVAGYVVENHQPRQGDELPLVERNWKVGAIHRLPDNAKKKLPPLNGQAEVERHPVLRLLVVHGVSDSFQQDWTTLELFVPPEIEVVMHEFPGHGHREKEEVLGSVKELSDDAFSAFEQIMDTGNFAILGHSIGCLIVTEVCKRARAQLGVEPVMVFMVERGAPIWPLWTEKGFEKLKNEPVPFMSIYQPNAVHFLKSAGALGQRTMDMWQRGWFCENDTMEVGYHVFKCPLIAIYAEYMVPPPVVLEDLPDEQRLPIEAMLLDGSKFHIKKGEDGKVFTGHFPFHTFEDWIEWTEYKEMFKVVKCPKCDHMSIKGNEKFLATVVSYCQEMIKRWDT